ncbi:MAG: hypothetical protein J6T33_09120, partial [Bacteroidales bacterium]|nr:hypothetical protein [Bacteroidales bacterium]
YNDSKFNQSTVHIISGGLPFLFSTSHFIRIFAEVLWTKSARNDSAKLRFCFLFDKFLPIMLQKRDAQNKKKRRTAVRLSTITNYKFLFLY